MKKTNLILNTIVKSVLIFSIIVSAFSCSSDDDNNNSDDDDLPASGVTLPADRLTTYTGVLAYEPSSGEDIVNLTGTAKITGSSSNYTISFSDNVPSISGITFSLINGQYVYVNPKDSDEGITIDEDNELTVGMTIDNNETAFSSKDDF